MQTFDFLVAFAIGIAPISPLFALWKTRGRQPLGFAMRYKMTQELHNGGLRASRHIRVPGPEIEGRTIAYTIIRNGLGRDAVSQPAKQCHLDMIASEQGHGHG